MFDEIRNHLRGIFCQLPGKIRVRVGGWHLGEGFVFNGHSKDLSRVFCNLMHPFYKPGAQILVIGAQGAHEYGAVRNNVGGVSCIKRTQGKTCLLAWITLPGYEILEGAVNMKAHIDGINTQMRHGPVAAHTFYRDFKTVAGGRHEARAIVEGGNRGI